MHIEVTHHARTRYNLLFTPLHSKVIPTYRMVWLILIILFYLDNLKQTRLAMKRSILFLALIIATAACKNNVGPGDDLYPFKIGTWTLQDSTHANWHGETQKARAKGDTVSVTDSTVHKLEMVLIAENQFVITFIDSSHTLPKYTGHDLRDFIEVIYPNYPGQYLDTQYFLGFSPSELNWNSERFQMTLDIITEGCWEEIHEEPMPAGEEVMISFADTNNVHVISYQFDVDGMVETMNHYMCD